MSDFLKALLIMAVTLPTRIVFFVLPFTPRWIASKAVPYSDNINPKQQADIEFAHFARPIERKWLPANLAWFQTPDQSLPGGLYVTAVLKLYRDKGELPTAANWIGTRNVLHGFAWKFGKPASNYMAMLSPEQRKKERVVEYKIKLAFFYLIYDHAIYRDWYSKYTDQGFWAVPRITVRRA